MRVSRLLWRYGLPVWTLGMLAVLGWVLLAYQGGAVRSLGSGFIYALLVLNFPLSLLALALFLTLIVAHQKHPLPLLGVLDHSVWGFVLVWGLFGLAGLLQWWLVWRAQR